MRLIVGLQWFIINGEKFVIFFFGLLYWCYFIVIMYYMNVEEINIFWYFEWK